MRFGSVCSGIEAASVAWQPLGWKAAWFSEIEPFPCAVLKHHYPEIHNFGDMTTLPKRIKSGEVEAPDFLCGGTPCQAFSVAGLRQSLSDDRGNLSLTFCEIANAIDDVRLARGEPASIIFWENVPGVLSTKDNAFGSFIGALAGCDTSIVPGGGRWTDAGVVAGRQRTVAWRILDAQYFGLAQRRKRVFVVASAREGFDPAEVLFEFQGLRRDFAPSRKAGENAAPTIAGCSNGGGANGPGRDVDSVESLQVAPSWWDGEQVAATITTKSDDQRMPDKANAQLVMQPVTHSPRGERFDASKDGTGRSTPLVPVAQPYTLAIRGRGDNHNLEYRQDGAANALLTPNGGRGGIGVGAIAHAIPMINMQGSKGNAVTQADGPSFTLNAMHGHDVHAVAVPVAQPLAIRTAQTSANGHGIAENIAHILDQAQGQAVAHPVAFDSYNLCETGDITQTIKSPQGGVTESIGAVCTALQVRRLTPVECERLQGFPDGYTNIPWRGKPESPDGPRYKALGNSWAVPVVQWIGRRIDVATKSGCIASLMLR